MKDPITLDHLRTLIEKANNGKPSQVYLCWRGEYKYVVTSIRLSCNSKLTNFRLANIEHDWIMGSDSWGSAPRQNTAVLYNTFLYPHQSMFRSYLYDNYWFAFAKMMQLNAEKVS